MGTPDSRGAEILPRSRRARTGCAWAVLALAAAVVLLVGMIFYGRSLIDDSSPKLHVADLADSGALASPRAPIEIQFDLTSVQLMMRPARAGEEFAVRAEFDEERYTFDVQELPSGDSRHLAVRFGPRSPTLAFLRMKAGGELPRVLVTVPADQPIRASGKLVTSFAAIEAGGLTVGEIALEVEGGGATVSFLSPLRRPMEAFSLIGDKGSLEVTGLGNASPRVVRLEQRFGELDLDLRGPWLRDAVLDVRVVFAGGTCWLPDDVEVRGLGRAALHLPRAEGMAPRPALDLRIEERAGRIVVIQ